jgi:hypothetical protein
MPDVTPTVTLPVPLHRVEHIEPSKRLVLRTVDYQGAQVYIVQYDAEGDAVISALELPACDLEIAVKPARYGPYSRRIPAGMDRAE